MAQPTVHSNPQQLQEDGSCYLISQKLSEDNSFHLYLYYFILALVTVRAIQIFIDWRQL